jgi:hypothetical protein
MGNELEKLLLKKDEIGEKQSVQMRLRLTWNTQSIGGSTESFILDHSCPLVRHLIGQDQLWGKFSI